MRRGRKREKVFLRLPSERCLTIIETSDRPHFQGLGNSILAAAVLLREDEEFPISPIFFAAAAVSGLLMAPRLSSRKERERSYSQFCLGAAENPNKNGLFLGRRTFDPFEKRGGKGP